MGWDLSRFWRGLGRRLWELRRLWRWLLTLMKDQVIRINEDNFFSDGRVGLRGRSLSIACGVGGCVRGEGGGLCIVVMIHSIGTTLPPAPPSVAPENNLTTKTPPNYTPTPFPRLIMAGIYIHRG